MNTFLKLNALFLMAFLVGCGSANKKEQIIKNSANKIPPPQQAFSNYGSFELKPMKHVSDVATHEKKMVYANRLETQLQNKLTALFTSWEKQGGKKLIIEPKVVGLRIVGGASRFFVGAMAGNSNIDLQLKIIDAQTKQVIAQPLVNRQSNAMAGGWSMGATDKNLVNYIADITEQYFKNNYESTQDY